MDNDEREIRQLVDTWMAATRDGDVETVMSLMSDDAVFLAAGQPVMKAQADGDAPQFDGRSDIHEVKVLGDWAFMWTALTVDVTPSGGTKFTREGNTLSVLRKENGKWLLVRDANTLPPMSGEDD